MWRMRVVHVTGYAYRTPVTASYNEARLTPRSDSRQNVIINRVETTPATRSYRYVDYWGTAVTAFDLHAPHTELQVTSSSVVETDKPEPPVASVNWAELDSSAVLDRFHEVLVPTAYTPFSKRIERTDIVAGGSPAETIVYSLGTLYGEWPDGSAFEGNRYVDRYVVCDGLITQMDVWNDSAEWLLIRAGLVAN